ncbi:cystathionine beta-lyase [Faustovirus]|nr:cystathionine beta-lyase [Faustovirus]
MSRLYPCDQIIGAGVIYTGSSFLKSSNAHPERSSLSYARTRGPNVEYLEAQLGKLYGCDLVALSCSGMTAIGAVLAALRPRNLVIHHEMYNETSKLCQYEISRNDGKIRVVDLIDNTLETSENVDMVLFESCTNPRGRFIEIAKVRAKYPFALLVVDNTTLSGAIYNPLDHDSHIIVVESLTKYVGAGEVIAGAIYARNDDAAGDFTTIWEWITKVGIRISGYDAHSLAVSLTTLNMRITHVSNVAIDIVELLKQLPFIDNVCYVMMDSVAPKYIKMGAGMIYFHILGITTPLECENLLDSSDLIHYATSYGKAESLFDPYFKIDENGAWIRLCVGYAADMRGLWSELLRLFVAHSGHYRRVYNGHDAHVMEIDGHYCSDKVDIINAVSSFNIDAKYYKCV